MDFFNFLRLLCEVMAFLIFCRAILSWFMTSPNQLTVILDRVTAPVVDPIRRIMPQTGMFDFSPLVAMIILQVIASIIP